MSTPNRNVLLTDICHSTLAKFKQLNKEATNDFGELIEKIEYCLGSFSYDHNPEGLLSYAHKALEMLKEIKAKKPRKVSKKLLSDLEAALQLFD
ncbi:MAG: hypothetical protein MI784_10770 [Cytophagales bacterium]|nr:hypothetical protein [Cytophagales bacterium]